MGVLLYRIRPTRIQPNQEFSDDLHQTRLELYSETRALMHRPARLS